MSMYRQIWLSIMLTTLLGLVGVLLASTLSTRNYLEDQLRMKNKDDAAFLALSLSQRHADAVEMQAVANAMFDSGYYDLIRVTDLGGKDIVLKKSKWANGGAPQWFVNILPLTPAVGAAQINDGWNQVGFVTLISSTRDAYNSLWEGTMAVTGTLLLVSLFGGWLGTMVLRRLKLPLREVIAQAQAITERHFVTTPESNVPELRQLTSAMNSTVLLLKKMFADEALRLEQVGLEANSDGLTKLASRNYFMAQLQAVLQMEDSFSGTLLLIRIDHLGDINRRLGRAATDNMLIGIASALKNIVHDIPNSLAARLNGADFGLLLPLTQPHPIADKVLDALVGATSAYIEDGAVIYIGAGGFHYDLDLAHLMAQVDAALVGAQAQQVNCVRDAQGLAKTDLPRSNEQWLKMIYHAIENRDSRLALFPVTDFDRVLIHNECPLRLKLTDEWLPAGRFLPIAQRLGMSSTVDITAMTLGLEELNMNREMIGLAINVSADSLQDSTFGDYIRALLQANPKASRRLWIEIPEVGAYAHFAAVKEFRNKLHGTGAKLGLEHVGRQFSRIGQLQELTLDYLKIDASFINGIDHHKGNQLFLRGVTGIAHHIGMQVFAEGVVHEGEMATLKMLGFDGVTGPGVKIPEI